MNTILNIRKVKQVLHFAFIPSSPRLMRSSELYKQSPAMNKTNRLGIRSPQDSNQRLSPFPIRNVNATANKKTEAYCRSFLFEFIAVIFKVVFTKIQISPNNPYQTLIKMNLPLGNLSLLLLLQV